MCPKCNKSVYVKAGFFTRKSDAKKIQKFRCQSCGKYFSEQTHRHDYKHKKRHINQLVFKLLCQGSSQRACAFICSVNPKAIARRVVKFGQVCQKNLEIYRKSRPKAWNIQLDELESFENTKWKPLTVPVVVEARSREILSLRVGVINSKGHLAKHSLAKYGYRKCERKRCLKSVLNDAKQACHEEGVLIQSDDSHYYPSAIKKMMPGAKHERFLSQRSRLTGLGELKRGGFDPIFSVNHTLAMMRDCVKRLARRTWVTTKKRENLQHHLFMYAHFHNLMLKGGKIRLQTLHR